MSGDPIKSFGLVVKKLRQGQKMSQESLAIAANLDRSFLSQLETGRKQPSLLTIFQLAQALGVSVADLMKSVEAAMALI
jgi:transcriptional regulator with XRE-family HTH domain